jgi:translocation and assembly module TamA
VYDTRNDTLDPQKGWYLTGGARPYFDALGESDPFTKLEAGARTYMHFSDAPDLTVALRGNIGSIVGSDTADIPATERFYAGGGGSVRGFGYQEVGPKDAEGDPSVGRSLVTGAVELRTKFTNSIGGVAFVDAGSVSDSAQPDFDRFSIGAGVGVRYYTGFGPLRFDIAVPLNEKEDLDQAYQFYISIGQAF